MLEPRRIYAQNLVVFRFINVMFFLFEEYTYSIFDALPFQISKTKHSHRNHISFIFCLALYFWFLYDLEVRKVCLIFSI